MIKRIVIYAIVFFAGLFAMRELLYMGLRRNHAGIYEKYRTMFLQKNDNDVLFLGSSRAEMHFNPLIFDSVTGHNSYNLGVTGATPRIAFAVLKAWCANSSLPKTVVFDIDWHFLQKPIDTIKHFPRYFPYLSNETLFSEFNKLDPRFRSFRLNPLHSLPYTRWRLLSASLHGWLGRAGKYDTCYHKGFLDMRFIDSLKPLPIHRSRAFINHTERQYLDSVIQFAKAKNIRLLLATSPMFGGGAVEITNKAQVVGQLKNIARVNGLEYHDFSQNGVSDKRSCFADLYHMNGRGARLFTLEFARFFKQYFDKKAVR